MKDVDVIGPAIEKDRENNVILEEARELLIQSIATYCEKLGMKRL